MFLFVIWIMNLNNIRLCGFLVKPVYVVKPGFFGKVEKRYMRKAAQNTVLTISQKEAFLPIYLVLLKW